MSNVPEHLAHLQDLTVREIEERLITFREQNERELTEEQLEEVVALHAIAMRKTAGPPKGKSSGSSKAMSDEELNKMLGV